jgi:4-hydroxy-tetrahydrodipicolinate synthase
MSENIFTGTIPALMTPCTAERQPDDALVKKGKELVALGMRAVVYCGSMGDWPLLTEAQRQEGVARLVAAGVPTIVGTGAVNSKEAVSHAAHAAKVGAHGLMVIPRVLSRGASPAAQKAHFSAILKAAPNLPAVIYNSPYYGFATRRPVLRTAPRASEPDRLQGIRRRRRHALCGRKHHVARRKRHADGRRRHAGVPRLRQLRCGRRDHRHRQCAAARSAAARRPVQEGRAGRRRARVRAKELEAALAVLSSFDEGCDLVLFYKHLMVLNGDTEYTLHFNETDALSDAQRNYAEAQYTLFRNWYANWSKTIA